MTAYRNMNPKKPNRPVRVALPFLALSLVLLFQRSLKAERFFELHTEHYHIRTNISREFSKKLGDHAELMFKVYSAAFPTIEKDSGRKIKGKFNKVTVYKTADQFYAAAGGGSQSGYCAGTSAFFFRENIVAGENVMSEPLFYKTMNHELSHCFLGYFIPGGLPAWFSEGIAGAFGNVKILSEKPVVEFPASGQNFPGADPVDWSVKRIFSYQIDKPNLADLYSFKDLTKIATQREFNGDFRDSFKYYGYGFLYCNFLLSTSKYQPHLQAYLRAYIKSKGSLEKRNATAIAAMTTPGKDVHSGVEYNALNLDDFQKEAFDAWRAAVKSEK